MEVAKIKENGQYKCSSGGVILDRATALKTRDRGPHNHALGKCCRGNAPSKGDDCSVNYNANAGCRKSKRSKAGIVQEIVTWLLKEILCHHKRKTRCCDPRGSVGWMSTPKARVAGWIPGQGSGLG